MLVISLKPGETVAIGDDIEFIFRFSKSKGCISVGVVTKEGETVRRKWIKEHMESAKIGEKKYQARQRNRRERADLRKWIDALPLED